MHATKAAVEEGIIPGGGVALIRVAAKLKEFAKGQKLNADEQLGVEIVGRAAEAPLHWIAQNAGYEGSIVAAKVQEAHEAEYGFNAQTEKYENLVKAGVIDPTKVVRAALQNASSIVSLLLTTSALVAELPGEGEGSPGPQSRARDGGLLGDEGGYLSLIAENASRGDRTRPHFPSTPFSSKLNAHERRSRG